MHAKNTLQNTQTPSSPEVQVDPTGINVDDIFV
jgi:hypothetical protein